MSGITTSFSTLRVPVIDMLESSSAATSGGCGSALRFLLSGALNTLASWGVYAFLLQVLPYGVSYTIAYAFGIALAYLLYRFYVYGRAGRPYSPLWVVLIYLVQYLLGIGLVNVWVLLLRQPALWAPLFSVAISLPLTYLLSWWVFRPQAAGARLAEKLTDE